MRTLSNTESLAFIQAMETILKLVLNNDDVEVHVGEDINDQCSAINELLLGDSKRETILQAAKSKTGGAKA